MRRAGKVARQWEEFKREVLFPAWVADPAKYFGPGQWKWVPGRPVSGVILLLRCRHFQCCGCRSLGRLARDSRGRLRLWSLDVAHTIGRDRAPHLRFGVDNCGVACRICNVKEELRVCEDFCRGPVPREGGMPDGR